MQTGTPGARRRTDVLASLANCTHTLRTPLLRLGRSTVAKLARGAHSHAGVRGEGCSPLNLGRRWAQLDLRPCPQAAAHAGAAWAPQRSLSNGSHEPSPERGCRGQGKNPRAPICDHFAICDHLLNSSEYPCAATLTEAAVLALGTRGAPTLRASPRRCVRCLCKAHFQVSPDAGDPRCTTPLRQSRERRRKHPPGACRVAHILRRPRVYLAVCFTRQKRKKA